MSADRPWWREATVARTEGADDADPRSIALRPDEARAYELAQGFSPRSRHSLP